MKARYLTEIFVPLAIVAVIATMLVPLPDYILDFLLAGNLILACILLMSSVFISEPIKTFCASYLITLSYSV